MLLSNKLITQSWDFRNPRLVRSGTPEIHMRELNHVRDPETERLPVFIHISYGIDLDVLPGNINFTNPFIPHDM
jgi:hypothetical protein